MKKISFIAALATLFIACNNMPQSGQAVSVEADKVVATDLAYLNVERVLAESEMFKAEGMPLQGRTASAQREWSEKEQKLQAEIIDLNQKFQKGLITSANAQTKQRELEEKARVMQEAAQKQAAQLEEENVVFANRAEKLLSDAVENINKDKRYRMIINASALIDADSTLDISTIVLDELNKIYKEEK